MKKYHCIAFIILCLMFLQTINISADDTQTSDNFTHTVFAEETTATWCPYCPMVAEALDNVYQSEDYPFYYVSLVDDMNPVSKKRNEQYSFGLYKIYAFPTVYFDGGDINYVGDNDSVQSTENAYRDIIQQVGERTPLQPIDLEIEAIWEENAKIKVTVTATNKGSSLYIGKLRAYVTEIESRWVDFDNNPYHFGLLDFAIDKFVLLLPDKPKTITGVFDGNKDHEGLIFDDIIQENIMVITTISNLFPHYRTGFQNEKYSQKYFSFYVDQTAAVAPI